MRLFCICFYVCYDFLVNLCQFTLAIFLIQWCIICKVNICFHALHIFYTLLFFPFIHNNLTLSFLFWVGNVPASITDTLHFDYLFQSDNSIFQFTIASYSFLGILSLYKSALASIAASLCLINALLASSSVS